MNECVCLFVSWWTPWRTPLLVPMLTVDPAKVICILNQTTNLIFNWSWNVIELTMQYHLNWSDFCLLSHHFSSNLLIPDNWWRLHGHLPLSEPIKFAANSLTALKRICVRSPIFCQSHPLSVTSCKQENFSKFDHMWNTSHIFGIYPPSTPNASIHLLSEVWKHGLTGFNTFITRLTIGCLFACMHALFTPSCNVHVIFSFQPVVVSRGGCLHLSAWLPYE